MILTITPTIGPEVRIEEKRSDYRLKEIEIYFSKDDTEIEGFRVHRYGEPLPTSVRFINNLKPIESEATEHE